MGAIKATSSEVYSKMLELTKDYEWTLFFTAIRYCMYEKACESASKYLCQRNINPTLSHAFVHANILLP